MIRLFISILFQSDEKTHFLSWLHLRVRARVCVCVFSKEESVHRSQIFIHLTMARYILLRSLGLTHFHTYMSNQTVRVLYIAVEMCIQRCRHKSL